MKQYGLIIVFLILALIIFNSRPAAQGGMSKATAKLLVSDLIEAGFAPQIRQQGNVFVITVTTDPAQAGTAAQVQAFATARSVTARVLAVQFE